MKKANIFKILLIFALVCAPAASYPSVESFDNRMQNALKSGLKGNEVIGVFIASLNRGDALFSNDAGKLLNPASCTKIITTAAALKLLGPDYRFKTKFYTDVRPAAGRVGKLWVRGYGDPSIVLEKLWKIARNIANTGLKEITGDIVIDDYFFDDYKYPGFIPESGRAYNSLTGAVSLNYNTVTVVVTPESRIGLPANVVPDTAGPYFRIVNSATTGPRGSKNSIAVSRKKQNGEDVIYVSGKIPVESEPFYLYKNITNPPLYFGLALKSLLEQNGIKVGGNVVRSAAPTSAYQIFENSSKPLSVLLRDMNKYSNNFIAEQVVKTLAAEVGSVPGTTEKGIEVISNFLDHLGIDRNSYSLINGSGLTQKNRVTSTMLVKVIAHIYSDFKIAPEALSTFSIAGVDGTVKDRLTSERIAGLARAKTGTLNGVSTLAGIIPSSSGEVLAYAILMNGNGVGWLESHRIQEKMLEAMAFFHR